MHLALLPPAIDKTGTPWVTLEGSPRLFLSCRPGGGPQSWGRAYVWNPNRPSSIGPIDVPSGYPTNGSEDFFCGGHAFLFDGRFLFVNGTDSSQACTGGTGAFGHDDAWVLDTHLASPTWIHATGVTKPYRRWYPTATTLGDQTIVVHGHTGCPDVVPFPDAYRDRFTWTSSSATGSWGEVSAGLHPGNTKWIDGCAIPTNKVRLPGYPRLHLASTGELVWTPGLSSSGTSADKSQFMNVDLPDCAASSAPIRWRLGSLSGAVPQLHFDGGSVQLITWDSFSGSFTEVFYLIGGANKGIEGEFTSCTGATVSSGVERMARILPAFGADPAYDDGEWHAVASLNTPRVNHNTVILLDGSLLVVGGMTCGGTDFTYWLQPERYMPTEVLDVPPTSAPVWVSLAPQYVPRGYHSTAVMLPSGQVVSAGGKAVAEAYHSVEVYTPGWGQVVGLTAPAIDAAGLLDPANDAYTYNETFLFNVTLAPGKTVDRVALIRNGSSTHAFNPDQRYVELARPVLDQQLSTTPNTWRLTVLAPKNHNWAPPGYYMLTVVDSAGVPAPAEWIRISGQHGVAGP